MPLDKETNMVIRIQGEAGSGKTWLIKQLKENFPTYKYSATTWIAGLLTESPTYYHALGVSPNDMKEKAVPLKRNHSKAVIIDEASMLSSESLTWLTTRYPKYTFILVGDWNQLPPVEGTSIKDEQIDFDIHLTGQHRQSQIDYYMFIQRFLNNTLNDNDTRNIDARTITREEMIKSKDLILGWHNSKYNPETEIKVANGRYDNISQREMEHLKSKSTPGNKVIGYIRSFRQTDEATAKAKRTWFNNEIFTVKERHNGTDGYIKLSNERTSIFVTHPIFEAYFENAESLTIHKIQGQTLDCNVIIDLDSIYKNFDGNIARLIYVAISRVKSWDQVRFVGSMGNPLFEHCGSDFDLELDNESLLNKITNENGYMETLFSLYNRANKNNLSPLSESLNPTAQTECPNKAARLYFKNAFSTYMDNGISNRPSSEHQFETLNPVWLTKDLKGHKTPRFTDNVASLGRFLFECDNPEDRDFFIEAGKKRGTRIVDSGNKSIHVVVSVSNPPKNVEDYKIMWNKMNNNFFDGKADKACAEPARLTRSPNAVRDNGNVQTLLFEESTNRVKCNIAKELKAIAKAKAFEVNIPKPAYNLDKNYEIRTDLTFEDGTWDLGLGCIKTMRCL